MGYNQFSNDLAKPAGENEGISLLAPRRPVDAAKPSKRSLLPPKAQAGTKVGSRKRLFLEPLDARGLAYRRFRELLCAIVADRGGIDCLSEGEYQLARRASLISVRCEVLESRSIGGDEIDLDVYGQLTDRLGRCLQRLGLKRVPKDVTDLKTYLAEKQDAKHPPRRIRRNGRAHVEAAE